MSRTNWVDFSNYPISRPAYESALCTGTGKLGLATEDALYKMASLGMRAATAELQRRAGLEY